jgi:protein-L-isoaspartate O-methyltransferase
MVIPMGAEGQQRMYKFTKLDENNFKKEEHGDFQFVPFLKGVSI